MTTSTTVFVFPGQGSQSVGMGSALVERYPDLARDYVERADEILGFALSRLYFEGPDDELVQTQNTQPAIFVVSMATLAVLRRAGVEPAAVAGHSLGEYSALVCAGVLEFEDALRLVRRRGELMAGANLRTPGAMAAIVGPAVEQVEELCRRAAAETGTVVEPANYNGPGQTVISGEPAGIERASALAREIPGKVRVVALNVGAAFHSSLMQPVAAEFALELDRTTFAEPRLPVVANVSGDWVRTAAEARAALRAQVAGPVRWTQTVQLLASAGYDAAVEVGPGRALSGMGRKIAPEMATYSTDTLQNLDTALAALGETGT